MTGSLAKFEIRKPQQDLFYSKNILASALNKPVLPHRRCTCKYLCHGAKATTKCLSCAIYDPQGTGYYCNLCFQHRHPWYRTTHIYAPLEEDESIGYILQVRNARLEADRYLVESKEVITDLQRNYGSLDSMKDQLPIEEKMKKTGRMVVGAEQRLIKLRRTLRQSLRRANPQDFPLDEDDSSCIIQRVFRGYRVRLVISLLYVERTVVVWEAASCRGTYGCK